MPFADVANEAPGTPFHTVQDRGIVLYASLESEGASFRVRRRRKRVSHVDYAPLPVSEAKEKSTCFVLAGLTHPAHKPIPNTRRQADLP